MVLIFLNGMPYRCEEVELFTGFSGTSVVKVTSGTVYAGQPPANTQVMTFHGGWLQLRNMVGGQPYTGFLCPRLYVRV